MERAADRAVSAGSERIGHPVKYKASAPGLLSSQIEHARRMKTVQQNARRAMSEGSKHSNSLNKTKEAPTLLIILKCAVVRIGFGEKVPMDVSRIYMRIDSRIILLIHFK